MSPRAREGLRTCLGCRGRRPGGELIRVVAGPGGRVCFDVEGRLPGRGAWVCAAPACLDALAAGALAHVLRTPVSLPGRLERRAELEAALSRRVANLLSMARRARGVVFGQTGARASLAEGRARFLLLAGDLPADAAASWAARAGAVPRWTAPDAAALGNLAGRAPAVAAAVTDEGLAAALRVACGRLQTLGAVSCDNGGPGRVGALRAARGSAAVEEAGER